LPQEPTTSLLIPATRIWIHCVIDKTSKSCSMVTLQFILLARIAIARAQRL
jgi:hypothetical protein